MKTNKKSALSIKFSCILTLQSKASNKTMLTRDSKLDKRTKKKASRMEKLPFSNASALIDLKLLISCVPSLMTNFQLFSIIKLESSATYFMPICRLQNED